MTTISHSVPSGKPCDIPGTCLRVTQDGAEQTFKLERIKKGVVQQEFILPPGNCFDPPSTMYCYSNRLARPWAPLVEFDIKVEWDLTGQAVAHVQDHTEDL